MMTASLSQHNGSSILALHAVQPVMVCGMHIFGKQQSIRGNKSSKQATAAASWQSWLERGFATVCCSAILK